MPAIDPQQLSDQIEAAVAHIEEPADLIRSLQDIFAFYADRTRRPSDVLQADDTIPRFGTPRPVVRQCRRALQQRISQQEIDPEPLIQLLWDGGERELRLVAVSLLADLEWTQAVGWTERLIQSNRDPRIVDALANTGLSGWQQVVEADLVKQCQRWLNSGEGQLQRLSLLLLTQHIEAASSDWLPRYFELLAGAAEQVDRQAKPVLYQVIRQLAQWNAAETAQFLLDEGRGNNWQPPYRQMAEKAMDFLPQAQQRELRSTLMTL